MSDKHLNEAHIAALVSAYADQAPTDVDPASMARMAAAQSAGPRWLAWLRRSSRGITTSWRANPMKSLVKIGAAVGALVLAVAAGALLGRPSDATVGTETAAPTASHVASPPAAPIEVTGLFRCGPPVRDTVQETVDVGTGGMAVTRQRLGAWSQVAEMSDERLEGTVFHTYEEDRYGTGSEPGPVVAASTHTIENDGGSWESRTLDGTFADGTPIGGPRQVLIGSGGYAGLIAVLDVSLDEGGCVAEVRGVIFQGAPSPLPFGSG
jgi:hypothetical protein